MKHFDNIIIGAGLSGLSVAHHLHKRYIIFEEKSDPGGLSAQYQSDSGVWFDYGGHYFHFQNRENLFDYIASFVTLNTYQKKSCVFLKDRFIPFPIQYNISYLEDSVADKIFSEINARPESTESDAADLAQYLKFNFGDTLYKMFFEPFLQKYYNTPLNMMIPSRDKGSIPVPSKAEVKAGYEGKTFTDKGYNPVFFYPESELREFIDLFSSPIRTHIRFNSSVNKINWRERWVQVKAERFKFENLISTMPLKHLLAISEPDKTHIANQLKHITTVVFNMQLRERRQNFHWCYLPDSDMPFYRFGYYPKTSDVTKAYMELSIPPGSGLKKEWKTAYLEPLKYTLKQIGVIEEDNEILSLSVKAIPVSYVIFDRNWDCIVPQMLRELKSYGIHSIGRYGTWNYSSMSEDIKKGIECANGLNNTNRSNSDE